MVSKILNIKIINKISGNLSFDMSANKVTMKNFLINYRKYGERLVKIGLWFDCTTETIPRYTQETKDGKGVGYHQTDPQPGPQLWGGGARRCSVSPDKTGSPPKKFSTSRKTLCSTVFDAFFKDTKILILAVQLLLTR